MHRHLSVTFTAVSRLALATSVVSAAGVLAGGAAVWQLEGDRPGGDGNPWPCNGIGATLAVTICRVLRSVA